MTDVRLKNIDRFIDRHGKPRHYYRARKGARVALPGELGSPEFLLAYEAAMRDDRLVVPVVLAEEAGRPVLQEIGDRRTNIDRQ